MNIDASSFDRILQETAAARLAENAAAALGRVPLPRLRAATRGRRRVAMARQTGMYLAHVAFGLTLTRVGTCFGRDRTTVRHACALIEDSRDDPARDFGLTALEVALLALTSNRPDQPVEDQR